MERCIKTMFEELCLRLLLFKVLNNPDNGRTVIKFGNDTDLIRMMVRLRKKLNFQRSRPAGEIV